MEQLNAVGKTNSFKVGIEQRYFATINSPDFWPSHIIFRRFRFNRNFYRSTNSQQSSNTFNSRDDRDRRHGNSYNNYRRRNNGQYHGYNRNPRKNYNESQEEASANRHLNGQGTDQAI